MIDVDLALAFTTGMVATVNPCGFVMLPAYLSFFLGVEQDRREHQPSARCGHRRDGRFRRRRSRSWRSS